MTNFEQFTEEQKMLRAFNYALMHAQGFLINTGTRIPELKDYQKELIALIEWLKPKLELEGMQLY